LPHDIFSYTLLAREQQVLNLKSLKCVLIFGLFYSQFALPCQSEIELNKLTIYSEIWPPFQTLDENGDLSGIATNQIKQILNAANVPFEIKPLPWARALHLVNLQHNSLIYSLSRITERESLYHWIYKVGHVKTFILSLSHRTDIKLVKETDLKQYTLILKRHEATNQYFLDLGFDPNINIIYVNNSEQALHLLAKGRGDIYPITESGFMPAVNQSGLSSGLFSLTYELKNFEVDLYLAAHIQSDKAVIDKLKQLFKCYKQ